MQSIVLLIVLLCFQVELDWFTEPAAAIQDGHMSKFVGRLRPISPAKAPRTLPEPWRHSDGMLKNFWARYHCGTTP